MVVDSDIRANLLGDLGVFSASSQPLTPEGVRVRGFTTGINAVGGAQIRLSNTTVTDNAFGIATFNGGSIVSFVNNRIYGNGNNGSPTVSVFQK